MYINKKEHPLSRALMGTALVNITGTALSASSRLLFRNHSASLAPDMTDPDIWTFQMMVSAFQIAMTALIFARAWSRFIRYRRAVPKEDRYEMAKLQEELLDNYSTLSVYSLGQLLQVWVAVLVGVRIIYEITSVIYRDFITSISSVYLSDPGMMSTMVDLYNSTHGFKYIGVLTAIIMGIFTTGIFLKDKWLKLAACVISACFIIAFLILKMGSITILGHSIGVVWTSVIFHQMQTLGLLLLALYLSVRYDGL